MTPKRNKPACLSATIVLAVSAILCATATDADAAKIRKRPPKQPLAPRVVAVDDGPAVSSASTDPAPPDVAVDVGVAAAVPDPVAAIPYQPSGSSCLYGEVQDSVTKTLRCLAPDELNPPRRIIVDTRALADQLGLRPPVIVPMPAAAVAQDAEPEPEDPPRVRVLSVSFENGAVGGALQNLRAKTPDFAACMDDNGGLRVRSARLKLLFFVRSNQKASGMIVGSSRNVPQPIIACFRKVIEGGVVGTPSSGAVGVTAVFELRNDEY
ncbi:MAG: hypothetical protein FWD57_10865 [Polyangiaceae bacterium]|nr:hypothetical protein [Polyangiaceae bacterium]